MIPQLASMINPAYRIYPKQEGKYLILEEPENQDKENTLKQAKVNIDSIKSFAVYKFDQIITIEGQYQKTIRFEGREIDATVSDTIKQETYAPFLTAAKGARAMCDFIIFYNRENNPEQIHAWVLNFKSTRLGNTAQQMLAGLRLTTFLLNKLEDIEKRQDGKQKSCIGHINFILFSLFRPAIPGTNPANPKTTSHTELLAGTDPAFPLHLYAKKAPRIGPISD